MTPLVAAPRNSGHNYNTMVSKTPRGGGSSLSQKSSDEGTHYHVHYHCRCGQNAYALPGKHITIGTENDKHVENLGNLPFLDIIPPSFTKNNNGKTKIEWSRHSAPQTGGSFRLKWAKHNVTEKPTRTKTSTKRNVKDSAPSRMGKIKTETTVRTYTKDGKRYEETTVVETKEEDDGTITTTTKTTTKTLGSYTTKTVTDGVEGLKLSHGGRGSRVSSTSSNDSSPTRVKSQHKTRDTAETKTKKGGLLNKFKGGDKSSDSSDDEEDFAKSVLNSVNEYRTKHGVAKLKLSKELNKYAKIWAKKLATDEKMSHNPDSKYGENVFCLSSNSTNFDAKPKEVVDHWYSEVKDHKFGEEPKGTALKSGHFSQLVWKDTKHMGVGKARSAAGTKVFVVANFDPQGNWMGQFADQVPPVGGFTKSATSNKTSKINKTRKSSSSSESSSDEEDFAEDCLKAHNDYRKKHGAQPLKLSKKLSKVAKEWCETIAKKDVLQHRPNNQYGENLYCYYSPDPRFSLKGDEAVKSWYSEIKDFKFGAEPRDLRAGHFTQVVWADSKELGVARVKSRSGKTYVVANYSPAGNFVGSFATQVPRLK